MYIHIHILYPTMIYVYTCIYLHIHLYTSILFYALEYKHTPTISINIHIFSCNLSLHHGVTHGKESCTQISNFFEDFHWSAFLSAVVGGTSQLSWFFWVVGLRCWPFRIPQRCGHRLRKMGTHLEFGVSGSKIKTQLRSC